MLKIINAYKNFGELCVVKNLNIQIGQEDIVGLAGPSGSGKSTLLRCIQGLDKFDSGEMICDGTTGFMFQDFQLFPHMSVLQNIMYAVRKKEDCRERAFELLEKLGLQEKAHEFPGRLSGGQRQRVAMARSLIMEPDLLLCDEPTSGLDVAAIDDIVALLKSVKVNSGKKTTIIIASHDLEFLVQIAKRVVLLRHGEIVTDMSIDINKSAEIISSLRSFYF